MSERENLIEFPAFRANLEQRIAASFTPRGSDVERCLTEIDALCEAATAFVRTTSYFRLNKASRPAFEALAHELIRVGAFTE